VPPTANGIVKPQPNATLRFGPDFIKSKNLVAAWLFNNGSAPVRDYGRLQRHATLTVAPTWIPEFGGALSFNGSSQYIVATGVDIANKPFTISALIRPGTQGIENNIVSVGTGTGTDKLIHIFTRPSAQGTGFGMYSDDLNISNALADATVYRITCTLTAGLTQSCYVYNINGTLHDSGSRTAGALFSGGTTVEMGRRGGGINDWFAHGQIFDVFIWDAAMTANEVARFSWAPYAGIDVVSTLGTRRFADAAVQDTPELRGRSGLRAERQLRQLIAQ
jgi:hypothetical protein